MDHLAAAGYEVYAFDFLGYGESDRFAEMSSEAAVGAPLGDLASMITQVESAVRHIFRVHGVQTINLIAHSAGTFAAALYAELHPQNVDRLVLFGAVVPHQELPAEHEIAVRFVNVSREDQLEAFECRVRDAQHLDPAMFESWAKAYLATDTESSNRSPPSVRVPAGLTSAYNDMLRSGQLPYTPEKISTPTLVIQGEWDELSPVAAGSWLYARLASPRKRLVILSQAGHRAHLERNRRQLYQETESFLNGGDETSAVYGVFFEVKPNGAQGREEYLLEAEALTRHLQTRRGFMDVERFTNRMRPGWLLSFSRWRDESSLVAWRELFEHRRAQERGRQGIFEDYRIRVARQVQTGGNLLLIAGTEPAGSGDWQSFDSLNDPGRQITLVEDPCTAAGTRWQVIRDYGLRDRRAAPRR